MPQMTIKVDDSKVRTIMHNAVLAVESIPKKVMRPIMLEARDQVREYPAELPDQRYVRTGKRFQATQLESIEHGYRIVSNPRYKGGRTGNPYVIGDARGTGQATIHKNRWHLLAEVMRLATERIIAKGQELFNKRALSGPGGL